MQAHLFAHAADLAFFAFGQHKAQLLGVLPLHLRRFERLVVQAQAVAQALKHTLGHHRAHVLSHHTRALWAVGRPVHPHQVFLLHTRVFADQGAGHAAVLGQHQQAGGVDVEPPGRRQAPAVAVVPARALGPQRVGLPLVGRLDEHSRALVSVFGLTADITHRLMQQDGDALFLLVARLRRDFDDGVGRHRLPHVGRLAVDAHPTPRDPFVGLAARAQAQLGHAFVQAHAFARRARRGRWPRPTRRRRAAAVGGGVA